MKNYICIGGIKTEISCETAENLKTQFGKEKPKELRSGDYGHYEKSGGLWWVWQRLNVLEIFGERQSSGYEVDEDDNNLVIDGNHVDDRKRNAEDLEEFEAQCNHKQILKADFSCCCVPEIRLVFDDDHTRHLLIDQAQEIGQKLLQMVAYAKRQEVKKDDC